MKAARLSELRKYLETTKRESTYYDEALHLPLYKKALMIQRLSYLHVLRGGYCRRDYIEKHLFGVDCPCCYIDALINNDCMSCPLDNGLSDKNYFIAHCKEIPGYISTAYNLESESDEPNPKSIRARIKMYDMMLKCNTLAEMQAIARHMSSKHINEDE